MLALQSEANVCRHKCNLKKSRLLIAQDSQQKLGLRSRTSNATNQRIDSRRMLHVVNSQNVFHELCFKSKTILYHVDLSFFASSNSVYFLHELKQMSNDVTGQHQWLVDSEVLLRSTRFKGRAEIQARVSQLFQKTTPSSNGHPNTCERILRNYNKHTT